MQSLLRGKLCFYAQAACAQYRPQGTCGGTEEAACGIQTEMLRREHQTKEEAEQDASRSAGVIFK